MPDDIEKHLVEDPKLLLALYRISQIGSSAYNVREAFHAIIEEVQQLFHPTSAAISLISPNSGLLEIEYAFGYPENTGDLSIHLGKGITGRVAFNGRPIILADVNTDTRYVKLVEGVPE